MSIKQLSNELMDIYSTTYSKDEYGVAYPIITLIYPQVECRIVANQNDETISNGKEKINPSNYRIYTQERLDITEDNFIIIDTTRYDILYVNKLYKESDHYQIDVKLYSDSVVSDFYFVWEQLFKRKEIKALMEDGKLWERE